MYETNTKFYVFYDKNDNVRCCGTAKQLAADGFFKNKDTVQQVASRIKHGKCGGNVVVLPLVDS